MKKYNEHNPNPVDKHVGAKLRERRKLLGYSQKKLGDALGITFQQVQKYENAANRIGASRMHDICQVLGINNKNYFYDGLVINHGEESYDVSMKMLTDSRVVAEKLSKDELRMLKKYNRLTPEKRQQFIKVIDFYA